MTNLTVPLAADKATTQHVQLTGGKPSAIGDRVDGRRSLLVYNPPTLPDGTDNTAWLWVGFDQNTTHRSGFPILPGGTFQVSTRRPVYGFAAVDLTVYTVAELDTIDPCDLPVRGR